MTVDTESSRTPLSDRIGAALAPHLSGDSEQIPALVDALLVEAHRVRASDLHLTSRRGGLEVRLRIDGDLHTAVALPRNLQELVIQRLKVMSRLVVYQRREPQDGRIDTELEGERVSLRAAFLPTLHGERVVIRFPDPRQGQVDLDQLGMSEALHGQLVHLLDQPQGSVLLTGPASSGKTTTIYAALRHLVATRGRDLNILTIEDPIEAEIEGVSQTQVDPGANLDFPRSLRAAMRQDPNVLVVGEIRDLETASTAIQAALTGHLLIATVHAGSSPGVFTRLVQMGVERYLLATAVSGVLNQRLARAVCPQCSRPKAIDKGLARALGLSEGEVASLSPAEGQGCEHCNGTGCHGRVGVFELLRTTPAIRQVILSDATEGEIASHAREAGQRTLRDDLIRTMGCGLIPPSEALRLAR
ncbi:type II/IV secretion system protein [Candidatus Sumerlaeota bacterium]|nr:type II/IV secretion system protein [Candidatus Sumerlaeota bacterium]